MTADATLHPRLLAEIARYEGAMGTRTLVAALRAVVELHAPHEPFAIRGLPPVCPTCGAAWPCSTIQAIADQLGLTQDQEQHREEGRRG